LRSSVGTSECPNCWHGLYLCLDYIGVGDKQPNGSTQRQMRSRCLPGNDVSCTLVMS
jgi:hypothetical protein